MFDAHDPSRRRALAALALAAGLALPPTAGAQANYPSKLITSLVAFPAGGQADVSTRAVVPGLQKRLGQTFVVENVGGVGGALGAQKLLSAPADGHTLLFGTPIELVQTPMTLATAKYKSEDFRLVGHVGSTYLMLVVRPNLPVQSVAELVALAKQPGKELSYGTAGRGSSYHLVAERFARDTGIKLLHVPYKGGAQILPDVVGGQIDMVFMPLGGPVLGMIQKGQLKALAITAPKRHPAFPAVPTMDETHLVKNFNFDLWLSLMVPKATPEPVVVKLGDALRDTLREPQFRRDLEAAGAMPAEPMTLAEADKFYAAEIAEYRAIGRSIDLKPE